jgi:hypothetical protein
MSEAVVSAPEANIIFLFPGKASEPISESREPSEAKSQLKTSRIEETDPMRP